MRVSIVTPSFNSAETIENCLASIAKQSYSNLEHIIVDGGSTDGTLKIVKKYQKRGRTRVISEPDQGIFDAMNKGIKLATGELVGILNSDDFYADNRVIEDVVRVVLEKKVDSCYGDILYVDQDDVQKVVRYWRSGDYNKARFRKGWMPPHPAFFVKKRAYEQYGDFDIRFKISADYELMLRFLYKYNLSSAYLPRVLVKMRTGGNSRPGLINTLKGNFECYQAWRKNGLRGGAVAVFLKPLSKIPQFFRRGPA